jgi:hypothetical protein
MATMAELEAQLEKVLAENKRLKGERKPPVETKVEESVWKGNPVLQYSGNFRPFSLGRAKCNKILETLDVLKAFVAKHPMVKEDDAE